MNLPLLGVEEILSVSGRLQLSQKSAKRLTKEGAGKVTIVPRDRFLALFPADIIAGHLDEMSLTDSQRSLVCEIDISLEGELQLPSELQRILPDGPVTAVGLGSHLELWPRDEYEQLARSLQR